MNKFIVIGLAALAMVLAPAIGAAWEGSGARTRISVPVNGQAVSPSSISTGTANVTSLCFNGSASNCFTESGNVVTWSGNNGITSIGLSGTSNVPFSMSFAGVTYIYGSNAANHTVILPNTTAANAGATATTMAAAVQSAQALDATDWLFSVNTAVPASVFSVDYSGLVDIVALKINALADSSTAPTVTACSGGTAATVTASNGTGAFQVDVGTSCASESTLVITLPAATTGWVCSCSSTTADKMLQQKTMPTASTTVVTMQNITISTGANGDFADGADVACLCRGI